MHVTLIAWSRFSMRATLSFAWFPTHRVRCETHGSANLGPAESFVLALGSTPDAKLRLEVLKMHHFMMEDFPKKVRSTGDREDDRHKGRRLNELSV